jgi:hypothetical protein
MDAPDLGNPDLGNADRSTQHSTRRAEILCRLQGAWQQIWGAIYPEHLFGGGSNGADNPDCLSTGLIWRAPVTTVPTGFFSHHCRLIPNASNRREAQDGQCEAKCGPFNMARSKISCSWLVWGERDVSKREWNPDRWPGGATCSAVQRVLAAHFATNQSHDRCTTDAGVLLFLLRF